MSRSNDQPLPSVSARPQAVVGAPVLTQAARWAGRSGLGSVETVESLDRGALRFVRALQRHRRLRCSER